MKRSPAASSCSSTSSSSYVQSQSDKQKQPKSKRAKRTHNGSSSKCQNNHSSPPSSARRSSIYRGVTRHRWTGRYEAHLWDKSSWNNIQNKKGRQVYLGAYDNEEAAAHTYDLAALKYWGPETTLNFPIKTYTKELEEMQKVTKEEYLASLRRQSSGFSRGVSKYRGVARHHHNGRWEARIGRVFGNKYLYLGTYNTQEEAAAAYDMAAIEYRGPNAVTNFDISHYIEKLKKKGIPLDHILQDQLPNCSAESDLEVGAEVEQPTPPQQQQIASLLPQLPPCIDTSTMIAMDPLEEHELTWNFFLDSGLNQWPVADLPLENAWELPDLFDDTGFEDNIDLIFEESSYGNVANPEYVSNNTGCEVQEGGVMGSMEEEEENGKERMLTSSSTSSSPCSTTTEVSCNYSV